MDLATRTRPDLALVNVALPEVQAGLALGRALQEHHVPVVYLTGHSDEDALAGIARVDPYGLVLLPVERYPLAVALEGALRRWTENCWPGAARTCPKANAGFGPCSSRPAWACPGSIPIGASWRPTNASPGWWAAPPWSWSAAPWMKSHHPEDLETDRAGLARLLAGEDSVAWEKRYVRPDGSIVWCRSTWP
jgi:hypothetical protein